MSFRIRKDIRHALDQGRAVVALESTVITHGLPKPQNITLAKDLEQCIREAGALPATVGLISGECIVGLSDDELHILSERSAEKASLWNLAALTSQKKNAGTTVATTLHAASLAGIKVFATGGIGGVHHEAFDESADLQALSRYPMITVCAGAKIHFKCCRYARAARIIGHPCCGLSE